MAITREQKIEILEDLKTKFQNSKGIVFAQNNGLSVEQAQALRRGLREANVDYKVAKKTLIKLAGKENGLEIPDAVIEGSLSVAFGYDDEIVAAQKMAGFAKEFKTLTLTGGVMEGKVINADVVNQLSAIPSREILLAKLMGSIMAPLTGFAGVLNGVLGGFVRVVNAYQEQRADLDGPAAEVETPPAVAAETIPEGEEAPAEPAN